MTITRTIRVETELPTDAERVWRAVCHPASFSYVTRGLFGWPALAGRTEPLRQGERGTGRLLLGHIVPLWRHTIHVVAVEPGTRTIRTHECGGPLSVWRHDLHVEPAGDGRCRYGDTVEIGAGRFTALVATVAVWIYRYRHRRWRRLVRNHLLPTGPRYAAR